MGLANVYDWQEPKMLHRILANKRSQGGVWYVLNESAKDKGGVIPITIIGWPEGVEGGWFMNRRA